MSFTSLLGERVSLFPLKIEHSEALYLCSRSEEIWQYLPIQIKTKKEMVDFIQAAITRREQGDEFPYAVYDNKLNKIIGMTRYLRIASMHKSLNIGWTWYSPEVWKTRVNTESKYLLLQYAFEVWEAVRVEIITTVSHYRSQKAIERLGANKEGILRKKYNGQDYAVYSIIDEDWPNVKRNLETLLTNTYEKS
ncbi:Protein N-acetyltransferase, RimJ/RimL family [Gracilibacillus ureilyticus]|uniref:Protein N-acetyltransferase, RimJ/RimL family n=1 Tax=Gracilibacillus ureilyticus TaxID=531814 RepID=A0A1H9W3U7_9BACI|nr:GNAT family protein [Gracilibacillus ureilyticus]SES28606.1 Protein N-acetyltransferase, RimJ/RimL family [Gracilibacillus ureilyticus]